MDVPIASIKININKISYPNLLRISKQKEMTKKMDYARIYLPNVCMPQDFSLHILTCIERYVTRNSLQPDIIIICARFFDWLS